MGKRLARTASEVGVGPEGLALIDRAHEIAMRPRRGALGQRDPRFLHPGRSTLVLLLDARVDDPLVLAATLLVESEDVEMRAPAADLEGLPPEVSTLRDSVPPAGDARLAEELVSSDRSVRLAALAERLDHLRHAHLWPDLERRRSAHREAAAVYHPVAARTHPALERRYAWWIEAFSRRHLG